MGDKQRPTEIMGLKEIQVSRIKRAGSGERERERYIDRYIERERILSRDIVRCRAISYDGGAISVLINRAILHVLYDIA